MKMVMMMMMSTSANPNYHNQIISDDHDHDQDQDSSTCQISWKLYNNPFFSSNNTLNHGSNPLKLKQLQRKYSANAKYIHHLHQSDLKMSSFSNSSDSQLNQVKTQVAELKSELEMERKLRKKIEMLNKKISRELVEEAEKFKEKLCVCEDLNKEILRLKDEMVKMKKDMEEERKMLRMAEVLREERVQMKLADAHLFYHHQFVNPPLSSNVGDSKRFAANVTTNTSNCSNNGSFSAIKNAKIQRKASPEAENPHIKQGIKGFVEFQRAIKAKNGSNNSSSNCSSVGSYKQSRDFGSYSKLQCQKAQLPVFFKRNFQLPYSHHGHLILS